MLLDGDDLVSIFIQSLQYSSQVITEYPCFVPRITLKMSAPSPLPTYLYKILPSAPPSPLPSRLPLSDLDKNDGYIHLSTADQVPGTADKFFGNETELYLLRIKYDVLAAGTDGDGKVKADGEGKAEVKWEEVGRGCFAHFYGGDLGSGNVEAVMRVEKKGSWVETMSLEY
jgi:uncharacterized protein (DUF952 family)